jgi:transposase InsO family protein
MRVDNGWPWGSAQQDLPPVLSLWLIGRGVQVVWNRPGRPQQNGVVERFNGLLDQWAEPDRCAN